MSSLEWSKASKNLYRRRWLIWFVAIFAHLIGILHRASMAPIADRLMADFGVSAVAIGGLSATYFYVYGFMQIPSGTLADLIGPRKVITTGVVMSAIGSIIMIMTSSFGILYVGRLIVSFGVSLFWMSSVKLIMAWFHPRERATVTGASSALANLGQVAAATPLALLIMLVDWRMAFGIIALVSFILAIAEWFIIRDSPAQIGLPLIEKLTLDGDTIQDALSCDVSGPNLAKRFRIVLGNWHLWPLFLVSFGAYGAYTTLFHNWAVVYVMQTYSVQRNEAANFVLVAATGMIIGGPLIGVISDRLFKDRRLPAVLFTGVSLSAFLSLTFWNSGGPPFTALYPLCFFAGIGTSVMPLTYVAAGDLVESNVKGMACGLVNMGGFIGAAIAQSLFGYLLDLGWMGELLNGARIYPLVAFQKGLLLCSFLAAIGFIGALLMKKSS